MIWRKCVDFPNYEVSRDGLVRRTVHVPHGRPPGILKPFDDRGYPALKLPRDGVMRKVYVHRLVAKAFLGLVDDLEVDHRQHRLDRVDDLRIVTRAQNQQNTRGYSDATSVFKGVSWCSARQRWYACIAVDGRTKSLGRFTLERDAARAYDRAAFAAWGEYAFLNFPAPAEAAA
jgi:hypothetical protein